MGNELHDATFVLTRYLNIMSVRISRRKIRRLLNNPMGNSMRGISDALDEINIKHNAYLVPAAILATISTPFIILFSEGNFHLVQNRNDLEKINLSNKEYQILIIESSQKIFYRESSYYLNLLIGWIEENIFIISIFLLGLSLIVFKPNNKVSFIFNVTTYIGCVLSSILVYKELFNKEYLYSYCKIGKVVDCNGVLNSKASRIGKITLGEIAFIYYLTLLFCALFDVPYKCIWTYGTLFAFFFSVWSIIYQFFLIHKICLLCFLLDCIIGIQTIVIFVYSQYDFKISPIVLLYILLIGSICMCVWLIMKKLAYFTMQAKEAKKQKRILLSEPDLFFKLLDAQGEIPMANSDITMSSVRQGNRRIQIILSPQCPYCASFFYKLTKLKESFHLLLFTPVNDVLAKNVALSVLACYRYEGFQAAMNLLDMWFKEKNVDLITKYHPDEDTFNMWRAQQNYLKKINLSYTPFITLNAREMPKIYSIEDLYYLI